MCPNAVPGQQPRLPSRETAGHRRHRRPETLAPHSTGYRGAYGNRVLICCHRRSSSRWPYSFPRPPRQAAHQHQSVNDQELQLPGLRAFLQRVNAYLLRWIRRKYKRLAGYRKARACLQGIMHRYPGMFAHWRLCRTIWLSG